MILQLATSNKRETMLSSIGTAITVVTLLLFQYHISGSLATQQQQQQTLSSYRQRTDSNGHPQLMVAIYCGSPSSSSKSSSLYHNQYLEIESRKWRTDRDGAAFCTQDKQEVLNYCRKVYPNHDIRNIVESSRLYKIDNWCKLGSKRKCHTRLTVKPYRCLEGTFQSDALLVPEKCLFDHVHNKSVCEASDHWNDTAARNCRSKKMKLQSFAMLQPCGLDVFSGVEFVCCPQTSSGDNRAVKTGSPEGNSFAQAAASSSLPGWHKDTKYDLDTDKSNSIRVDDETSKHLHHNLGDSDEQEEPQSSDGDEADDDDEYEDDDDEYDDDSTSWNGDKSSSTSTTTSTTTTTTTTTTTERPIDHYLGHFDLAHEHDEFRRAELAVESNYRDKITQVMKEWSQLDVEYLEMKKKDPQAAEEFKKKMTHQFQKTIDTLEEEGAAQRHQLASMHAERAMAIINRRKKAAMDCLTQALDRIPIRTRQVERCIVRLLKALEKDRTHTLRQYKNLLNLNTREALREKKIILDHLVTLNRAANQSIAMLDRSPVLVDKLKTKIVNLWHKLRNIPLGEPIVRESELKVMEKYEEEVAQRKIEREHQRLIDQEAVQDSPQESPNKQVKSGSNNGSSKSNNNDDSGSPIDVSKFSTSSPDVAKDHATVTNKPEPIDRNNSEKPPQQHLVVQEVNEQPQSQQQNRAGGHETDLDNEIHYQIDSAKFSHLKADPSHHELSYSVKHEPIENQLRFGFSTLLVSACMVVIVVAIAGMKYYGRNSTRSYRRQGFAEVGRSCPEEKSVTNMQFNGYENPAYKFFEAEA